MNDCSVFVGLDYHQDSVQACVLSEDGVVLGNRRCRNDVSQVALFAQQFGCVRGIAIESCEGVADFAEELLTLTNWSVHLAHPGYVSRMRQNPDKTDYSDARMLADLERVGYVPRVWLAPLAIRELRRLTRYRQQLVDERRGVKLRIRALLREHRERCDRSAWTVGWLSWLSVVKLPETSRWILDRQISRLQQLKREIQAVEAQLAKVTCTDPEVRRLRELPGIGWVTAWVLRAEVGRFDRFRSGKQLARFCGLSPRNASTGNRQADAGLIHACNRVLRAVIIEAAHRLRRYDRRYASLSKRMRAQSKPGSVIAAAVGNRWMRWLYYEMTKPVAA